MLTIRNTYNDRDITVTSRNPATGQDGETVTIARGDGGAYDLDGDHQLIFSTRAREPGEAGMSSPPQRQPHPDDKAALTEADDDTLRATMAEVVAAGHTVRSGAPSLEELNKALEAKGHERVTSQRRDALFAPA